VSISFSPEARADLQEALEYLSKHSLPAAERLHEGLAHLISQLDRREFDGPELRLKRTGEIVRSWPLPPWRIYYQRADDVLWLVRIYHQARRPIAT
jgi:plasmid stabilization system protein ParE